MLSHLLSYIPTQLLSHLPSYPLLISMVEAVALLALFVALQHVRRQMQSFRDDPASAPAEMRALVQEAQTLSMQLANQLAEQVQAAEQGSAGPRKPVTERHAAGPRAMAPRGLSPEEGTMVRDEARARGMDPLGFTLQRSLPRVARPAS